MLRDVAKFMYFMLQIIIKMFTDEAWIFVQGPPLPQQVPAAEEGGDGTEQDGYSVPESLPSKAPIIFKVSFCLPF